MLGFLGDLPGFSLCLRAESGFFFEDKLINEDTYCHDEEINYSKCNYCCDSSVINVNFAILLKRIKHI